MKLSVCYIVKNEAHNLPRSLASVKPFADELIVVDTGSTDDTPTIAKRAGARFFSFAWIDDFAAARNFALDYATGDWIVFPDADECFCHPDQVREAIDEADAASIDVLLARCINLDMDKGGQAFDQIYVARAFRNSPDIRYVGKIHENIDKKDGVLRKHFADSRLDFDHTGYSSSVVRGKVERNLALLLEDIKEHGEQPHHAIYLKDCYFGLKDFPKALYYAKKEMESPVQAVGGRSSAYHTAIESLRQMNGSLDEMKALAEQAIEEFPTLPEFYGELGMILCGMGRLAEAKEVLEKAAALYERPAGEVNEGRYYTPRVAGIVYERLGELSGILGQPEEARQYFARAKEALDREPKGWGTRISACYIVRNEEKPLERSIASLRACVDDLVVVDTGSEDGTKEVAERQGARLFSFEWRDDFAAARNYALDQATGDWIVFLDADEYFSEETGNNLREAIGKADMVDVLLVKMRNIEEMTGEEQLSFYAPRVFRRKASLRYEGRIHEELRDNGGVVQKVAAVPPEVLSICHTGYSTSLSKAKGERNLRLLLAELSRSEKPEQLYMYLAETYDGLGMEEEAMRYARLDIAGGRKSVSYASRSYRVWMRCLAKRPALYRERLSIAEKAVRVFPELPEFHAELAECLAYHLRFIEAIEEAREAIKAFHDYNGLEPLQMDLSALSLLKERIELWTRMDARQAEIEICACVIVKNEEKDLPRWLENSQSYANRILVVDTGSEDATARIAKEAGCEVYSFAWDKDFSHARNFALDQASGDWVAFLDADETFDEPPLVRPFLAETELLYPQAEAVSLVIRNVDEDDGDREIQRFPAVRLFRLRKELCYRGNVHETLARSDGKALSTQRENYRLTIRHTGYSSGRIAVKTRRNLALLREDIEKRGEGPQHYRYLAECFFSLRDYASAERYARMAIEAPLRATGSESDMYHVVLRAMEERKASVEEQILFAEAARDKYPLLPDYHGVFGLIRAVQGHESEAEKELLRAVSLYERPEDTSGEASRFAELAPKCYATLTRLAMERGEISIAKAWAEKAIRDNPYDEEALWAFYTVHANEKPEAFDELLAQFFPEKLSDTRFLSRWAERQGLFWLWRYYADMSEGMQAPRMELYEMARHGELPEAYQKVINMLGTDVQRLIITLLALEPFAERPAEGALLVECERLLPPEMRRVWAAYRDEGKMRSEDAGIYGAILNLAVRHGTAAQVKRMGTMAKEMSYAALLDAGKRLVEAESWEPALEVLSEMPSDAEEANGDFWRCVGICLYHLGNRAGAEEALQRAKAMGCALFDVDVYLEWLKEAGVCG